MKISEKDIVIVEVPMPKEQYDRAIRLLAEIVVEEYFDSIKKKNAIKY